MGAPTTRLAAWIALALGLVTSGQPATDLDAFMARVLERRNETWRVLHDYILSERERFRLTGPAEQPLFGTDREYTWFVQEGLLVRSPVRFDGVTLGDARRREYEARWFRQEKNRETLEIEKAKAEAREKEKGKKEEKNEKEGNDEEALDSGTVAAETGAEDPAALVSRGIEPRFVSEAYFLRFKFEPGNYYLAGREVLDGRDVLRIEYYPTRLFKDALKEEERTGGAAPAPPSESKPKPKPRRELEVDVDVEAMERKMNKVSLVTLWVDVTDEQIVKYTFENLDMDFMPGRWLVRVEAISASMEMGQYFGSVWLPKQLAIHASVRLASGPFEATYRRDFYDYRLAETKARIRGYDMK